MHGLSVHALRLSRKAQVVMFAMAIMMFSAVAAFAQATPEVPSSSDLTTAATGMMTDLNLWPFVIAFGILGLVVYLARRSVKMVR